MNKNLPLLSTALFFLVVMLNFLSCTKDKSDDSFDFALYQMAKSTSGYVYFGNSGSLLPRSSGSGHSKPFLRTRYNAIAATNLDSTGRIINGSVFPEGAVVVKELFDDASSIGRYAVLYKKSGDAYADADGWIWGYINEGGSVAEPAANKGRACIGCHSQTDNIDHMLMNKYFQ